MDFEMLRDKLRQLNEKTHEANGEPLNGNIQLTERESLLASLLLQTPRLINEPIPEVVERSDLFKRPLGSRVYLEVQVKKNANIQVHSTSNKKVSYLTANVHLAHSKVLTMLRLLTFSEVMKLRDVLLLAASTGERVSITAELTTFEGVYQLKNVQQNPLPRNGMWREYAPFDGVKSTLVPKLIVEALQDKKIGYEAVRRLYTFMNVNSGAEFSELTRRLNLEQYSNAEKLLIDVHIADGESAKNAKLALEILATASIVLNYEYADTRQPTEPIPVNLEVLATGIKLLSFEPTKEQIKIALGILASFQSEVTTKSIIYGDVGFGKTAVAALIIFHSMMSGKRCVLLSPTENLANQTYENIVQWFPAIKSNILLVTNSTDIELSKQSGSSNGVCFIGTSALMFRDNESLDIDISIVDEEQRFGVDQRAHFEKQGSHYIAMTATPIPVTCAQTLLSYYRTYRLTKCFTDKTFSGELLMDNDGRRKVFEQIKRNITIKRQTIIICPLTTDSESMAEFKSVETLYHSLSEYFGYDSFSYIHSKLSPEHNQKALQAMHSKESIFLVASTAIEVGIDIDNVEQLIIFHPERLGLSQIHQLRGRLVRQGGHGHMTLYSPTHLTVEQIERLNFVVDTTDGSSIAEYDAKRRGVGDITGKTGAQSGIIQNSWIRHLSIDFNSLDSMNRKLNGD
ncbi:DEAD/DEAH box helicase [Vibrio sp. 10N.261.45.A7]